MNLYYEVLIWAAKLNMLGLAITTFWALGVVVHDRYVNGNVDAFKPERRMGPADRRAHQPGR
ncbi:hypothetical protein [Longimicrobium sp.]|uniref:hypothetical protein n=1 Tax=Longimicrobium sp. TaxID=2029185 RepID=UPI002E349347|nr:hypothetical protein [Longimicrobium sp.]HEX6036599.1 hypothetical protein [Longimicrobium sp.]